MKLLFLFLLFPLVVIGQTYPTQWFQEILRSEAASWEILPQDAEPGEVILSKRTELGIFSNLGAASFTLDEKRFASIEGLWQSLKYPDPSLPEDPRTKMNFPHLRSEVEMMSGFEAKDAGNEANIIYKKNGYVNV